jgi:hypothetical protein
MVRGMATWPEGFRGWPSPGGGWGNGGGSDNPGGGGDAPVGRGGQEVEGPSWGAARSLAKEEVTRGEKGATIGPGGFHSSTVRWRMGHRRCHEATTGEGREWGQHGGRAVWRGRLRHSWVVHMRAAHDR